MKKESNVLNLIMNTACPHPPGDTEVMRNNESHWSDLSLSASPFTTAGTQTTV
jgi:hypothetical protein